MGECGLILRIPLAGTNDKIFVGFDDKTVPRPTSNNDVLPEKNQDPKKVDESASDRDSGNLQSNAVAGAAEDTSNPVKDVQIPKVETRAVVNGVSGDVEMAEPDANDADESLVQVPQPSASSAV